MASNPEIKNIILNSAKVLVGPKQVVLRGAADDYFDVSKASDIGSMISGIQGDTTLVSRIQNGYNCTLTLMQGSGAIKTLAHDAIGIVAQAGGTIDVESAPGQGTSFLSRFPAADTPTGAAAGPQPLAAQRADRSSAVLVVDDTDGVRQLVQKLLQREGFEVFGATNTDEALRAARELPELRVVVTDVVMPGRSGVQLALELEQCRPDLKVIFMSGYTPEASQQRKLLPSSAMILQKPFAPEALLNRISSALAEEKNRPASESRSHRFLRIRVLGSSDVGDGQVFDGVRIHRPFGWMDNHERLKLEQEVTMFGEFYELSRATASDQPTALSRSVSL